MNGTKAALAAEYSENGARGTAARLLTIDCIKFRIDFLKEKTAIKCGITAEMLAEEYKKLAFSNMQDLEDKDGNAIPLHELPRDVAAAIQSVKGTEIKLHSKEKALDSLGRHIGFFEKDNEQQQIVIHKPLTEQQLKDRLAEVEAAGNGIDNSSIG
jgi:phage terminase small subunit